MAILDIAASGLSIWKLEDTGFVFSKTGSHGWSQEAQKTGAKMLAVDGGEVYVATDNGLYKLQQGSFVDVF